MPQTPSHARRHDQFYTRRDVASRLVEEMAKHLPFQVGTWVEPSAGDGSFVDALKSVKASGRILAIDLDPARKDIAKADFLVWGLPAKSRRRVVAIGNPPFGKNASLAVKFFNHAASFADAIGMIFPRTFQKHSLQNRLSRKFSLVHEEVLPENSFLFEGKDVAVPCVFQLWIKNETGALRPLHSIVRDHQDFSFVSQEHADFAFQRVGVAAGKIKPANSRISHESHLYIRVSDRKRVDIVKKRLETIDWRPIKLQTAGNPSIGKGEIVAAYAASLTSGS